MKFSPLVWSVKSGFASPPRRFELRRDSVRARRRTLVASRCIWIAALGLTTLVACSGSTTTTPPAIQPEPTSAASQSSVLIGTWSGAVVESSSSYQLAFKIERLELGSYAGTDVYSGSVNCEGLLTYEETRGGISVFQEVINKGPSPCENGRVEVFTAADGRLEWQWYKPGRGGAPQARGTLTKTTE